MDPQKLPEEIDKLRSLRKAVADRNRTLAERGLSVPLDEASRLEYQRDCIRIAYERDVMNAEAEAVRLGIELGIEQLKALFAGAEQ